MNQAPRLRGIAISAVICLALGAGQAGKADRDNDLQAFFAKSDVTIAVTDSGLGGLSIMADAASRLKAARIFHSVNLVFFNALFSNDSGYNSLRTREEKIAIFNSALESLAAKYRPDMILVGCNTLSVLIGETRFAKTSKIPVLDIVEPGLDLIVEDLKDNPETDIIIFGTETTISEGEHKKKLQERGIPEARIVTQACPELAAYIEKNPNSEDTALLIESYVDEALAKFKNGFGRLLVSLNCTHFGYSMNLWRKAFERRRVPSFTIVNPNALLAMRLISRERVKRYEATAISAKAVSMAEISRQKIEALGGWLRKISPETADALARYELKPDLFEWKKFISK